MLSDFQLLELWISSRSTAFYPEGSLWGMHSLQQGKARSYLTEIILQGVWLWY